MQPWLIAVIAASAVLFIFLLLLATAFISDSFAFGKRCDKNPLLKYFTAEDFCLTYEPVSTRGGLKGYIYRKGENTAKDKLVIFCHGMGPGHIAYTTEIAYLCNLGFSVLALDSRGCNLSDGKNLKGMYSGVETVKVAIDFARATFPCGEGVAADKAATDNVKIYLVGHSWGAYSALCASAERKVQAVVAISAPTSPSKTLQEGAVNVGMPKFFAALLRPLWWIVNLFKFGAKGNLNAAKCAQKNGVPTLLIHGDRDKIVSPTKAAYNRAKGANITKLLVSGKAHNPYITENAERLLAEIPQRLKNGEEGIKDFDFSAATEEDSAVMQKIALFLQNN